jgi:hypothetical protein
VRPVFLVPPPGSQKILETFFLVEEKTAIRVQNFRQKQTFQDLFAQLPVYPKCRKRQQRYREGFLEYRTPGTSGTTTSSASKLTAQPATELGVRHPKAGVPDLEAVGWEDSQAAAQLLGPIKP